MTPTLTEELTPTGGNGCICQMCGRKYLVDWLVPDDIWEQIKPAGKSEGAGMLCGACIANRVEGMGLFQAFECNSAGRENNKMLAYNQKCADFIQTMAADYAKSVANQAAPETEKILCNWYYLEEAAALVAERERSVQ